MNKNSLKNHKSIIDAEGHKKMFSSNFLNLEIGHVVNQIDSKGFFFL